MALNDIKEITVPVNGTNKAVKKIEDSNGNIIWGSQSAFPYRKLANIAWWCNSTFTEDDWKKGLYIPTDIKYPSAYGQDITIAFQPYKNQKRYSPLISNYIAQNQKQQMILNVNQDNNNTLTFTYNDGTYTSARYRTYDLDSGAWNSNIATEQAVFVWTNQPANNAVSMRRGDANNSYTCDTNFYATLGNTHQTAVTLPTKLATNPPVGASEGLCFFHHPATQSTLTNTQYFCGKLYRVQIMVRGTPNTLVHDLVPAQRKSDNRVGLFDTVTKTFYPESNNYQYDNFHLQLGAVIDEYWDLTA